MSGVVGVDGVGPLWVAAVLPQGPGDGGRRVPVQWRVGDAVDVIGLALTCEALAVDIPVGFVAHGQRSCEREARAILGRDRSSIFPTPPRPAFAVARVLGTQRSARVVAQEASRGAGGPGISTQAWGLVAKVLAVEDAIRALPGTAGRVVETHPETAFRVMDVAGRTGAWPGKRSAAGVALRLRLIAEALGVRAADLEVPELAGVPVDDALDALAAAWTAGRVLAGTAATLGSPDAAGARWSDGSPAPQRAVIVV